MFQRLLSCLFLIYPVIPYMFLKKQKQKNPAFFPATVLHSGGPRANFYQNKTLTLENITSRLINGLASKEMI